MNANDPQFTELALKNITCRASEDERVELTTLLSGDPELQAEYENLRADAVFAKQVLPLLGDDPEQIPEIPGHARERLRASRPKPRPIPAGSSLFQVIKNWRWSAGLCTVAAAVLILIVSYLPQRAPESVIQVAMLDTIGETRGIVWTGPSRADVTETLMRGLQITNLTKLSTTAEFKLWLEHLPNRGKQSVVKVLYDRDAREIHIFRIQSGQIRTNQVIRVDKEENLAEIIRGLNQTKR